MQVASDSLIIRVHDRLDVARVSESENVSQFMKGNGLRVELVEAGIPRTAPGKVLLERDIEFCATKPSGRLTFRAEGMGF
jgi:hypothetical protein